MKLPLVLLVAACAAGAAGCTGDDSPDGVTIGTPALRRVAVYLVRDGKVAPVRRTVTADDAVEAAHTVLAKLGDPTLTDDEQRAGYSTAVPYPPTDTAADAVNIADGVARVGVWRQPLSRIGQAQVVYTLTGFREVKGVVFVSDGEEGPKLTRSSFEAETPQILVQSPLPGDSVRSPIRLRGTANVFEATVSIDVRDASGKLLKQTFTTATSGTGTRGTFDTEVALPRREGAVTVVAYEASAEDGRPLHVVELPLELVR